MKVRFRSSAADAVARRHRVARASSAVVLAGCVLILVALSIGGTHPDSTGGRSRPTASTTSDSQPPLLSRPGNLSGPTGFRSRIGKLSPETSVPLLVTVALIALAAVVLALIIWRVRRRRLDWPACLMLLGLLAAIVLVSEVVTAHPSSISNDLSFQASPSFCQGHGATIEVRAGTCTFGAIGPTTRILKDDLLPTDLEFETRAGERTLLSANNGKSQFAMAVSKCSGVTCTLLFEVPVGTSTKRDSGRDFTRTTTFVDSERGPGSWYLSVLRTSEITELTKNSKLPTSYAKPGSASRTLVETLSGAVLVLIIAALVGRSLTPRRRRSRGGKEVLFDESIAPVETDVAQRETDVLQLLAEVGEVLNEEAGPRAAVLRCWVELERLLGAIGLDREPSETADELTTRLIATDISTRVALVALRDLYITARYSSRPFRESDRDAARALLHELRTSLAENEILSRHAGWRTVEV